MLTVQPATKATPIDRTAAAIVARQVAERGMPVIELRGLRVTDGFAVKSVTAKGAQWGVPVRILAARQYPLNLAEQLLQFAATNQVQDITMLASEYVQ